MSQTTFCHFARWKSTNKNNTVPGITYGFKLLMLKIKKINYQALILISEKIVKIVKFRYKQLWYHKFELSSFITFFPSCSGDAVWPLHHIVFVFPIQVMIYLIEGVLPEGYFANNLRGLSVDMAVFRDLLRGRLQNLSRHLDRLQNESKDSGKDQPVISIIYSFNVAVYRVLIACYRILQEPATSRL